MKIKHVAVIGFVKVIVCRILLPYYCTFYRHNGDFAPYFIRQMSLVG